MESKFYIWSIAVSFSFSVVAKTLKLSIYTKRSTNFGSKTGVLYFMAPLAPQVKVRLEENAAESYAFALILSIFVGISTFWGIISLN
jgi:hypothetical protein